MKVSPLPNSLKQMIEKDIEICNQFIKKGYCTSNDVGEITCSYRMYIKDFTKGLSSYMCAVGGPPPNAIDNMKKVKKKLEILLAVGLPDNIDSSAITITNMAIANNNVNLDIKRSIQQEQDISEPEKSYLLSKIDELQQAMQKSEPKENKWKIAKSIISFVVDKGADFAITCLPAILNWFSS